MGSYRLSTHGDDVARFRRWTRIHLCRILSEQPAREIDAWNLAIEVTSLAACCIARLRAGMARCNLVMLRVRSEAGEQSSHEY